MNETMGSIILRLRREKGLTQEQLANELGISYQAVSKWETGNSCPDLAALPLLADLFGVSIDTLFGRAETETAPVAAAPESAAADTLPWPDDGGFYAVLYHGHELIGSQSEAEKVFRFQYEGPAQNVSCSFDLEITGEVCGDAAAGGDLTCGAVYGSVEASGDVTCDSVSGNVRAGGDVTCDDVTGSVSAGGDVTCDDVDGSVTAGGDVTCDEIAGSAFAGESVHSEHPDLDAEGDFSVPDREDIVRGLGSMAAWGVDLGRRVVDAVERSLGKPGRTGEADREDEDDA